MQRYNKYILYRLIGPLIIICFSLTALAWLAQSLRFIDMIVNRGASVSTFLYLSSLIIPSVLWPIMPAALFISILVVYNRLLTDSELTVLHAAGVSKAGLMKPILVLTSWVTLFSMFVGAYLLPATFREFKDLQTFLRDNPASLSLALQEGVFTSVMDGLTVYFRERGDNGELHGIVVHDTRKDDFHNTYTAKTGRLMKDARGKMVLYLENGSQQNMPQGSDRSFSLLFFDRYPYDLNPLLRDNTGKRWREPKERYLNELFNPTDTTDERQRNKLTAEGHYRISWPLYNFLMMLTASMAFLRGEFSRRGRIYPVLLSIKFVIVFYVLAFVSTRLITDNPSLVFVPYLTIILSMMLIYYLIHSGEKIEDGIKSLFTKKTQGGAE